MKEIILILSLVIISVKSFSQVTFKPGVRTGFNIASITETKDGSKTALYIGAFGELRFGGKYALQPEIGYSSQGSKRYNFEYLSIKLTNKFYGFKGIPMFLLIAPGIDFDLQGNTQSYSGDTYYSVNFEADLSFSVGLGYDFPNGLGVETRYKRGIIDVHVDNFYEDDGLDNKVNSVVQMGVFYKFGKKRK